MSCIVGNRNKEEQGRKLKKFSSSAETSLGGWHMLDDGHKSSHVFSFFFLFSKVPITFRARKAIRKTATRLFCKQ